jgi:hypothetical protein
MRTKNIPVNKRNYFTKSFAFKGMRIPFNVPLPEREAVERKLLGGAFESVQKTVSRFRKTIDSFVYRRK